MSINCITDMNAFKLPLMAAFLIGLAVACGKPEPDPGHGQTTPSQPQVVAVSSVSLDKTSVSLNVGESVTLAATVKPDNATNKTVTWSSSSSSVASVDASGKVSAVAEGTATITAKAGDKTATCSVTVTKKVVAVESVTLDKSSLELNEGETATLTATVKPDNASDKTVTWSSSKTSVATVDANGKVTAVAEGTATITAKAGDKTATCSVTVKKNVIAVESVTLDITSTILNTGETLTLTATVKPDNATDKTVTWSSSNSSVATVDANGKVTAVAQGTAIVTAKAGDKTATCTVIVMKTDIPVESITLDKNYLELTEGGTGTITATVKPDNATNKTVTWSSNNPLIASVDQNGTVTGQAEGTTTITAKAGGKTATCTVTVKKGVVAVESITLDITSAILNTGETLTLIATVKPDNATNKTVTWSSSNSSVATVDANGKVTAVAQGTVTITAKAGDKTATCTVTVMKGNVPVESLTLDKSSLELTEGETATLIATVKPDNATDKTVTWSSSNPWVATVDQNGQITAVRAGEATITATVGGKYAYCTLIVKNKEIAVESITLDKTSLELFEGEFAMLYATVLPWNAPDKTVTWTSSNPSVATVDQNGRVTALHEGTAAITAKAGDKTATCTVFVKMMVIPVYWIGLDHNYLELKEGETTTIIATVKPDNATNKTVTWSSSDPSVATVDQNGRVTALHEGTAAITAKAGDYTATCTITVKIPVQSVTLDKTTLELDEGETVTLHATVLPENAADKTVTWTSSNPSVASVDQNGKVTALHEGTAAITAKAGDYTATCTITVKIPVQSVTLDKTTLELDEGETVTLHATVLPENAADKTVTWTSSNPSVVTVDQSGKVTALYGGTAIISAKAGDRTATCTVTVRTPVESVTLNTNILELKEGDTATLHATVSPWNATDQTVTWTSSNPSVASVDQNGKVTALQEGTAVITAKAGDKTATCSVTVKKVINPGDPEGFNNENGEW